jgi:pyruvate/2-oxoglutarate dehydrogenase complex dihydrolipoamide acyltransferase (E2) component
MSLALPAAAAFVIVVFGLIGLIRDVQRGFLSLIGTLLGVTLVQIWGATWAIKVEEQFGWAPSTATWVVSSTAFLLVAILVGYGSSAFIPKKAIPTKDKPKPKALARPASGLLGALNGAMIASILLLYARGWAANENLQAVIVESLLLSLLIEWFSWFVLGVTVLIGTLAFCKWTIFVVHRLATPMPVPVKPTPQTTPKPAPTSQPAGQPAAQTGTQNGAKPASGSAAPQTAAAQNGSQTSAAKPAQTGATGAPAGSAIAAAALAKAAAEDKAAAKTPPLTPEQQKIADKNEEEHLERLLKNIEKVLPPDK